MRYYIKNFGYLHFKGTGIEDNYYLLRPIWLNNGEQVVNKRTFLIAKEESNLVEGVDFIISIHEIVHSRSVERLLPLPKIDKITASSIISREKMFFAKRLQKTFCCTKMMVNFSHPRRLML